MKEVRRGTVLERKVMDRLNEAVKRGTVAVSSSLERKIQSGSIKIQ